MREGRKAVMRKKMIRRRGRRTFSIIWQLACTVHLKKRTTV
jgi:hypothetical protein